MVSVGRWCELRTEIEEADTPTEVLSEASVRLSGALIWEPKALSSELRRRRSPFNFQNVHPADIADAEAKGWKVQRRGKRAAKMRKEKSHDRWLEDRVWKLFHSMGFKKMNGAGFHVSYSRPDGSEGRKQIDVYAEDEESIIIVECKSKAERGRRTLQKDLHETIALQNPIRNRIYETRSSSVKPKIIWIYATSNILWSEPDVDRAAGSDIKIITDNEIQYFEAFVKHMGPASKYQILGEFLKGQKVPGLGNTKIPAIRGKIGGEIFYSFVTTPRNLLKIAFINHQALNHPDGRPAYQRMISSSRIKSIGEFIEKGGFFPTNVLINFSDSPKFDLISNSENTDKSIKFGWLTLPGKYRSAWIIDGQHRLYGFSKLEDKFLDQSLFVLAFERMAVQKEADLFITINHKQKSVPKSLLLSLLADIRMGDGDPSTALTALGSAVVRALNTDNTSPFSRRFAIPGVPPEPGQNLTVSEVVNGLRRSGLIGRLAGTALVPGALSGVTDADTVTRAAKVLNAYFEALRAANPSRWEAGREAHIAVNPGIRAHLIVIGEVVSYLTHKKSIDFPLLKPSEFTPILTEFCQPIFNYLADAGIEEVRSKFSRKFGEGGVKEYSYELMSIIRAVHADFGTEEFQRWVVQSSSDKIDSVNQFIMKLSERLIDYVIATLKDIHGTHRLASDEPAFWEIGVESERIRRNAFEAQQRDKQRRKPKEAYLNIVDLAEIVKQENNWPHFEYVFKNPRPGERAGQKYYLNWIQEFNEIRNIAAHKNHLKTYTDEDLEFVEWLREQLDAKLSS